MVSTHRWENEAWDSENFQNTSWLFEDGARPWMPGFCVWCLVERSIWPNSVNKNQVPAFVFVLTAHAWLILDCSVWNGNGRYLFQLLFTLVLLGKHLSFVSFDFSSSHSGDLPAIHCQIHPIGTIFYYFALKCRSNIKYSHLHSRHLQNFYLFSL